MLVFIIRSFCAPPPPQILIIVMQKNLIIPHCNIEKIHSCNIYK